MIAFVFVDTTDGLPLSMRDKGGAVKKRKSQ